MMISTFLPALRTVATVAAIGLCAGPAMAQEAAFQPDFLTLDGTNAITVVPDERLSLSDEGTIEFWVRPTWEDAPDHDPIAVAYLGPDGPSYVLAVLRDRDGLGFVSGEEEALVAFDFADGYAHHVALNVYTDGSEVYVDGELLGSFDLKPADLPGGAFFIGSANENSNPFVGNIGQLRIWDVPILPQYLKEYSVKPLMSDELGDHPDIAELNAFSDFSTGEFFLVDSSEPVE